MSKWKKERIDYAVITYAGGTPNRSRDDYFNGDIPWISSGEVNQSYINKTKEQITLLGLENSSARWITKGAVLLAMYGATAGQVAKLKIRATANQAVLALLPNENIIDKDFLYHLLNIEKDKILFFAQGSGQPNLSKGLIDRYFISFPESTKTQITIAKILDTCDIVIEQTQSAITKYKAIKQGMLHDLFTRGLDANGKLRSSYQDAPELYKSSELGMIPKEWEVKRLEECCKGPCNYGINAASVEFDSKLPLYLRITDITDNGQYNKSNRKCVDDPFSDNYILQENDIVLARTGATVGKSYLYNPSDGKLIYAGFLIKFSPDVNLLNSYYLKSYTETSKYWNWVNLFSQRSGQPGINGKEYSSLKLSIPPIDEQNEIAQRIYSLDNKLHSEEALLNKYQSIKHGLMGDLLSGKKEVI